MKDMEKMTANEKKTYKKRLAYTRAYSADMREWRKLKREGNTTYPNIKAYRESKYGKFQAALSEKIVVSDPPVSIGDLEGKLERLLNRIKETRKETETELRSLLG